MLRAHEARYRKTTWVLAALLLWTEFACAQLGVSDNVKMNLNGDVWFGYNGGYGNTGASDHGIDVGGNATMQGSYYNPKFLSFMVQPFYGRTSDTSALQSITSNNGVNFTTNVFSGSNFPGVVSYNRTNNNTSSFGLPETAGLAAHGNSQAFTLGWSELVPGLPSLSATFSDGAGSSEVFGTNSQTESSIKTFNLRSQYNLKGFQLNGFYTRIGQSTSLPSFLSSSTETQQTDTNSNTLSFTASHVLPLHGTFNAGWNHFTFGEEFSSNASASTGSTNTYNAMAVVSPLDKLGLSSYIEYTDNLSGLVNKQLIALGAAPVVTSPEMSVKNLNLSFGANYAILKNLGVQGNITRQQESAPGYSFAATRASGTVNFGYARPLFGILSFSVGAVDTATEQGNTGAGLVATVNANKHFGYLEVGGDFSYTQNVQTVLLTYTTSSYSFGSNVRRKFGKRDYITGAFRGYRTGMTQQVDSGNHAENFNTALILGKYSLTGTYSQSNGTALYSSSGLTPISVALLPVISPGELILYSGRSYGGGIGAAPIGQLTISASYSKALSDTTSPITISSNESEILNIIVRYRLRKILVTGGFTRLNQSISAAGTPPISASTYYFGISRWFNFF